FGIQKLGAIVSPCSPLFKHHELNYQLLDLECRVIIAATNLVPIVQAARPQTRLQHVISTHYGDFLPECPAYSAPEEIKHHSGDSVENTVDLCTAIADLFSVPIMENIN